jgi:hypothetical protein
MILGGMHQTGRGLWHHHRQIADGVNPGVQVPDPAPSLRQPMRGRHPDSA